MLTCNFGTAQLTSFNEWYIYMYMYVTGQHKNKAGLRQTWVYITHLQFCINTYMVKTQLLRVQNVHTKYYKYFRGFFNSRLLNLHEIREN